ncbi:hypothetical protein BDA99DRAFT_533450 [Phascolomyces articulosus]|uniref:Uncharacterized protein n=1 Tax=Phascolomyces articulosus TaxID=60185 RepID=A0AAD5K919_9FUNG|nr:hypothetical protein BDA99DRAFT_533450 [Phascolomyces articulosus]
MVYTITFQVNLKKIKKRSIYYKKYLLYLSDVIDKTDRIWTISESDPSIRIGIRMLNVRIYEKHLSTKNSSGKLSESNKQFVNEAYVEVSIGKSVENEMKKLPSKSNYEHLSHFNIIDPNDKLSCSEYFTEADINENRDYQLLLFNLFLKDYNNILINTKML